MACDFCLKKAVFLFVCCRTPPPYVSSPRVRRTPGTPLGGGRVACVLLRPALSAGHGARHTPAAPPSASVSLCPDSHPRPWCQDLPALQTHRLPPDPGLHLRPRGPPGRPGDWRPERPGAPACLPSLTLARSWGPEFENGFRACVVFSRRLKRGAHGVLPTLSRPRGRCGHRLRNWVDDVTGVSSRARSTLRPL